MSNVGDAVSKSNRAGLGGRKAARLLLFGTNMLSSFPDSDRIAAGLDRLDLVVCHELFMYETTRRFANIVLPGTAWLEDVGCKATNTHIYLMDRILSPAGEVRPVQDVLRGIADRLGVAGFYPWASRKNCSKPFSIIRRPDGQRSLRCARTPGEWRSGSHRCVSDAEVSYAVRKDRILFRPRRSGWPLAIADAQVGRSHPGPDGSRVPSRALPGANADAVSCLLCSRARTAAAARAQSGAPSSTKRCTPWSGPVFNHRLEVQPIKERHQRGKQGRPLHGWSSSRLAK